MAANHHEPKTLWDAYGRRCMLVRNDGVYELHLRHLDRTTTLETCHNEDQAHHKAAEWLEALKALSHE
jgi:hypothetical protein